jgi:preprotein translocase subunit SecD
MPRPRSLVALACLLALAAGASACGGSDSSSETSAESSPPDVVTVNLDLADATPEQTEGAAEVVRARLAALDLPAAEVGWDLGAIEVIVPAADEALARAALTPAGALEFRPVLAEMGATAMGPTPMGERRAEVQITAADLDGGTYVLGPAALSGDAVESAAATSSPSGTWTVDPVLREGAEGIDALNALAAACFAGDMSCPATPPEGRGKLAILLDGVVLVAPSIEVDRFDRDQIQISGDWDEAEASAVAAVLTGGVADVAWTVQD